MCGGHKVEPKEHIHHHCETAKPFIFQKPVAKACPHNIFHAAPARR